MSFFPTFETKYIVYYSFFSSVAANATAHGYKVLWSTDGVWYLDGLDVTWDVMYAQEPCNNLSETQCNQVIGGGGEMWGETVDTSDLYNTVWPRLAAIAERLWSPRDITDLNKAHPRIHAFRYDDGSCCCCVCVCVCVCVFPDSLFLNVIYFCYKKQLHFPQPRKWYIFTYSFLNCIYTFVSLFTIPMYI